MKFSHAFIAAMLAVAGVPFSTPQFSRAAAEAFDEKAQFDTNVMVDKGLIWLKSQQKVNGSWESGAPVAATALSVMAMMARGHTPGQGPYGESINRGIDYVLSIQSRRGLLSRIDQSMYEHGIATVMLCEAYGMLDDQRQVKAKVAIANAVRLILDSQNVPKNPDQQGGWRYQPDSNDSDISVTGWQLMALRGAAKAGANVPKSAIEGGIAYIKRRAVFGGGFSYTGNDRPNAARSATGILALELMNQHNSKESLAAGDFLLNQPVEGRFGETYYYTVYYCSQAAWQLGDRYWENIGQGVRKSLSDGQLPDGSWPTSRSIESQGGNTYATAMAILALSVPYRYLPIYQR